MSSAMGSSSSRVGGNGSAGGVTKPVLDAPIMWEGATAPGAPANTVLYRSPTGVSASVPNRLRLFSGTSNPVSDFQQAWRVAAGDTTDRTSCFAGFSKQQQHCVHGVALSWHFASVLQALAQEVACYLGLDLGGIKIKRFADGEIYVQVLVRLRAQAACRSRHSTQHRAFMIVHSIKFLRGLHTNPFRANDLHMPLMMLSSAAGVDPRLRCVSDPADEPARQ